MEGQMSIFDFPEYCPDSKKEADPIIKQVKEKSSKKIHSWIGDDYLPDIMKKILSEHGYLIGDLAGKKFEKSSDYIKPLERTVFKNSRNLTFFVDMDLFTLRWANDRTDGSVLIIKNSDGVSVANILTREIIEAIQEKYNPKLDQPRAPIWHMSLNHVWEECPNCKAYNKGQIWRRSWNGGEGYWENLDRCPECGQKLDWSDEAIEKACKYSKDYLEAQRRNEGNDRTL